MDEIQKEILKAVKKTDYVKGLNYDEDFIDFVGMTAVEKQKRYQFLVKSESSYKKYMVQIEIKEKTVNKTLCTCPQFYEYKSCKHVAACLVCYSDY